jgi:hypothetical protein
MPRFTAESALLGDHATITNHRVLHPFALFAKGWEPYRRYAADGPLQGPPLACWGFEKK